MIDLEVSVVTVSGANATSNTDYAGLVKSAIT